MIESSDIGIVLIERHMTVTILICTASDFSNLRGTLESIADAKQTAPELAHIQIVNNSQTKWDKASSLPILNGEELPVIQEPVPGLSRARNTGVAHIDADYIIFTDDDVTVPSDWLQKYMAAFKQYPDAAFFGGEIKPYFPNVDSTWAHAFSKAAGSCFARFQVGASDKEITSASPQSFYPFGANMAFRADVLRDYKFDESLGRQPSGVVLSGEETDVISRMVADGHTGVLVAENPVTHWISEERQTLDYVYEYYRGQGWGQARALLMRGSQISRLFDIAVSATIKTLAGLSFKVTKLLPMPVLQVWLVRQKGHFSGRLEAYNSKGLS